MPPYLSVILPTFNRIGVLRWALMEYARQSLSPDLWECVVVNDGGRDVESEIDPLEFQFPLRIINQENAGPATARNTGAKAAHGKALLFVGDDCIPTRHLLYYHWMEHASSKLGIAVQGYTDWHPDIPNDSFHQALMGRLGFQANWNALRNQDGSWRRECDGFFLTTNVSINKREFERLGGFDERFPRPAWEDIELGIRVQGFGVPTLFQPNAMNYHFHKQTLDGFVKRQLMEGESRLVLCSIRPELAGQLLDPNMVRQTTEDDMRRAIEVARITHHDETPEVQEIRLKRWSDAFRLASLEGIRRGVKARGGVWQALQHIHTNDQALHLAGASGALDRGDTAYANICSEWMIRETADNWASWCVHGEVMLAMGRKLEAITAFSKSVELASNDWAGGRLKEIVG